MLLLVDVVEVLRNDSPDRARFSYSNMIATAIDTLGFSPISLVLAFSEMMFF